jgi:hypothetical protein
LTYFLRAFGEEDSHDYQYIAGVEKPVEEELHEEFVRCLRDDAASIGTEMVHSPNAAPQLRRVMGSIRFPVMAFVAPNRISLIVADVRVEAIEGFRGSRVLFRRGISERNDTGVRENDLQEAQESEAK